VAYKVFLVEDETITREGIRDYVDWGASGFVFCGEAPDGEVALPLIEEAKPDVLITDIKMPFMDGLQLSKVVHEFMPWIKVIILSGHDEFEYAQSAIKLGVTDYLLKPVSADDLHKVLRELAVVLDREKQEREKLKELQESIENNLYLNRERFLVKLVTGGVSAAEAIEQSHQLGLDIVARYYLVVFFTIQLCDEVYPEDYQEYQRVERIIFEWVRSTPNVFLARKDLEEFILLLKGDHEEQLVKEGEFLAGLLKEAVEKQLRCSLVFEMGSSQDRLGDLHHSFTEAFIKGKGRLRKALSTGLPENFNLDDLLPLERGSIENYLRFGLIQDFDGFFEDNLQSICTAALNSDIIKHFLFVDILLTARQFLSNLGVGEDWSGMDMNEIERMLGEKRSSEQVKGDLRRIFEAVIECRNHCASYERELTLSRAMAYIERHIADPELRMSEVAQRFNVSTSYFSTIFHQESGETFTEHLSRLRIDKAKTLLRTTNLKMAEIAARCGFNDPHYFSTTFKRKTGITPMAFRDKSRIA
jgi:two-component system response regulator YesN